MHQNPTDPLGTSSLGDRVEIILTLTRQLSELIGEETEQLKARRPSNLRHTEERKFQLSTLYAREMRAIQARPQLLHGVSAAQKQALRTAAEKFQEAVTGHARRLVRTSAVTKALVVAIGEELTKRRQPATRYGASGSGKTTHSTMAFSHDRSI